MDDSLFLPLPQEVVDEINDDEHEWDEDYYASVYNDVTRIRILQSEYAEKIKALQEELEDVRRECDHPLLDHGGERCMVCNKLMKGE